MNGVLSNKSIRRPGMRELASALAFGVGSFALSVALATPAHAQESQASLRGTITVEGGATQITAREVNTGFTRTAPVGPDGSYNFPSLRPGTYMLQIATAGGIRQTDTFTLSVAQDAVLDFDLTAPPAQAAAEGAATAPTPEGAIVVTGQRIHTMEGGEVGATISQREIEQLPQNNRNFLAFADLAPGVAFITEGNGNQRLQGGAQQSRTTNVFIDGVGQKDYVLKNGITGQDSSQGNPFPQSAIGEYRVISSNYKAEYDQVSSVAVTAITKSGTNEFHGDMFVDFTNQDLRAKRPDEDEKIKTRDFQFGISLGGPIIRDKAHFFFAYEGKRQETPRDIFPRNIDQADIPAEYQDVFGTFSRQFNEDLYFGKVDFEPTDRDLFELSVKVRRETGVDLNNGSNALSTATNIKNDETRGLLRYERTGDNWVNDLKITYENAAWNPTPRVFENAFLFQNASGQALFQIGGGSNFQDKGQKGWGIQNDFTYTGIPGHTIKAGVKAKWVKLHTVQENFLNPRFVFNTEFNPMGGTFNDQVPWQVVFGAPGVTGDPEVVSRNFQLGLYIQDDWDVTDRFTLNYGVRWDMDRTPSYLNFVTPEDALDAVDAATATADNFPYPNLQNANYNINNFISNGHNRDTFMGAFQPRVGFSWELDPEARTVLFGGFGRSYDRNSFDFLQQEVNVDLSLFTTRTIFFNTGDPNHVCSGPTCFQWDPKFFDRDQLLALVNAIPGGAHELRFISNDLKIPYSDQFSLGVRHRLNLLEGELGYTHITSRNGFAFLLGNRRPDGSFFAPGEIWGAPFGFPPPGFGSIIIGTNGLKSNADSVYFKLNKRYTHSSPWNLNVAYTFTLAEENRKFNEVFSLDYPSLSDYPILRSTGVSKHRLVAAGAVDLPLNFILSGKLTLASPPYIYGIRGLTNAERRPVVTEGRNKHPFILPFDIWAFREVDLALTKYIPFHFINKDTALRLRVDVLNVFNTKNFVNYNGNANSPDFGTISNNVIGGNLPRTFKLTAGFSF